MIDLHITICPAASLRLELIAKHTGRTPENLAATAVEEECLNYFRTQTYDPGSVRNRP